MVHISGGVGFAAGAAFAVAMAGGTAYAATGGTMIIGKGNYARTATYLSNSAGSPLSLAAKSGYAPLRVNSSVKVPNLNSDKLDGMDGTALALKAGKTGVLKTVGVAKDLNLDGTNDAIVARAACPAGTVVTGGGHQDVTETGYVQKSVPDGNGWYVEATLDPNAAGIIAYVVCYNPRGAVPGGS